MVDDSEQFGRRFKRALLDFGSIGAMVVTRLGEAADLILSGKYHFDALLTDYFFVTGEDSSRSLYDGFDLIQLIQQHNAELEVYAFTAQEGTSGLAAKAASRDISVRRIFDKKKIALAESKKKTTKDPQPWDVVRADILRKRLLDDPSLAQKLALTEGHQITDLGFLERFVNVVKSPTTTYIQQLNRSYDVTLPIEAVCTPALDGKVSASAPKLGILLDGIGATPAEAID
ncbi:hypothetical protein, partial [Rhodoplanes sp. SY1]|uniref:hypothetical protein n=1 Tax=Rhodoplanes sp. SY1 TaxID=3166646 RepID=UPI0038B51819